MVHHPQATCRGEHYSQTETPLTLNDASGCRHMMELNIRHVRVRTLVLQAAGQIDWHSGDKALVVWALRDGVDNCWKAFRCLKGTLLHFFTVCYSNISRYSSRPPFFSLLKHQTFWKSSLPWTTSTSTLLPVLSTQCISPRSRLPC